jgi:hypothetical protein
MKGIFVISVAKRDIAKIETIGGHCKKDGS